MQRWFTDTRGDLAQFAFVAPLLVLVSLGLINLALYGMAGVNANNAANYGARVGSVAQTAVLQTAVGAANAKLATTSFGDYAVSASQVGSIAGNM